MRDRGQQSLDLAEGSSVEVLDVTVTEQIYRSDDGTFAVLVVKPLSGGRALRATGDIGGLVRGEQARLRGRRVDHPTYGPQLVVDSWEPHEPRTAAGIERFLAGAGIEGVGKKLAHAIVEKFGTETLEVICEKPHLLRQVRGLGKTRAKRLSEAIKRRREEARVLSRLRGYGLGTVLSRRIREAYGDEASEIVEKEPYRLAREIKGIGFVTADRIGRELGLALDSPERVEAALLYLLDEAASEGHTALPVEELIRRASRLEVDEEPAKRALAVLEERGQRRPSEGSDSLPGVIIDEDLVYLPRYYHLERRLAQGLLQLARIAPTKKAPPQLIEAVCRRLSPRQAEAVEATLERHLVVITGGPGTGKTTTLEAVAQLHSSLGSNIALAAPTGRAARRLGQVAGLEAKTIHRLLEYSPTAGFQRNEENPLSADLVIVDEASMLDLPLARRLVGALEPGATLLLVGDVDQLPSVGVGTVLRDIIDSGICPVVRLDTVFRQAAASNIVVNAHRVNRGELPIGAGAPGTPTPTRPDEGATGTNGPDATALSDFYVIGVTDPRRAVEVVGTLVSERIPRAFGFDPFRDIQVLAPMYRGTLGCDVLNDHLRDRLGVEGRKGPKGFREGDKVMQLKNNYEKEVFNGDIGQVATAARHGLQVIFDGRPVVYEAADVEELRLAYCITVHKSQGSEYPAVVMAIHDQHHIMLARNLLYTAITRGKKLVVLVGSRRAMLRAAKNDRQVARFGRLRERIESSSASQLPW